MTKKKARVKFGRLIKRKTGVDHVRAMILAKHILAGKSIVQEPEIRFDVETWDDGGLLRECAHPFIEGPKGRMWL